ncbi:MAG: GNAT family N-acetyltransferase [Bacillota bacterium]|nr:GNAT family N-acetyltransferase [Bacillota bacterium]
MTIFLRHFSSEPGFSEDFIRVRDFFKRIHEPTYKFGNWDWVRWEWGFSLPYLDETQLSKIGVWEDDGRIVALATYETTLGEAYFAYDQDYAFLKKALIEYAVEYLAKVDENGAHSLNMGISESDDEFRQIARDLGFTEGEKPEYMSTMHNPDVLPEISLPAGYSIVSMAEENDLHKINRVLWRGFNHPGEPPESEIPGRIKSQSGPDFRRDITLAVKAPNGNFVSYCGMWYTPDIDYAVVEPVATDPDYRRMGIGKAVVLEGIRRCFAEGAVAVYVGSGQQFYFDIGFKPIAATRRWSKTW